MQSSTQQRFLELADEAAVCSLEQERIELQWKALGDQRDRLAVQADNVRMALLRALDDLVAEMRARARAQAAAIEADEVEP